ncbi:sensor histidine kinase [Biostraticola tofi]|uniref:Sensor histidine kinase DcuS n=1 Tax=Biostraticola tofi TaxID=466109 RepID=A0A4R3YQV5_9GAMM|nr:sensor histidine kinase [Biostraticola tofi]TCV95197.1 two-component system sensor histidine kinase DcuS [Biostraticola tofi]
MNTPRPRTTRRKPLKLGISVALMVSAVLVSVLLAVHALHFYQLSHITRENLQDKAENVGRTLADSPTLQSGLLLPPDALLIQNYAERVREHNNLLFVVVTNMAGIRYSHRDPTLIGKPFIGEDLQPALQGKENTAVNRGVLDEALRVFVPIFDQQHRQLGVVVVGISLSNVAAVVNETRWSILWTVLFGMLVGSLGTWALVYALKRIMLGFEPYEISDLFEQRHAMLQSIKEGVIAVDADAHIQVINQEAKRMFTQQVSLETLLAGNDVANWPMLASLQQVLISGIPRRDEEISFKGRLLLTNTVPIVTNGIITGAICTFRDKTEVSQLVQRLTGMVNYADALRAQSHEFMNKLHVILGLLHMKSYPQLEDFILKTATDYQAEIGSLLAKIKSPVIAGFLLGKINRARDAGIALSVSEDSLLPATDDERTTTALITVLGNLIENALDAQQNQSKGEIHVSFHHQANILHCVVGDDGPGITAGHDDDIFQQGFSTKGEGRGLGLSLVRQCLDSLGGSITVESEPGVYTQFYLHLPYKNVTVTS